MSMFMHEAMRGYALGAKYGIREGIVRYNHTTETPKMDDSAMQGAIGIIIAVGGVLIALYIIAVVVGSISYAVTSGNIKLSPTWNNTISKLNQVEKIIINRLEKITKDCGLISKRTANWARISTVRHRPHSTWPMSCLSPLLGWGSL
jgi:hypothetical protein